MSATCSSCSLTASIGQITVNNIDQCSRHKWMQTLIKPRTILWVCLLEFQCVKLIYPSICNKSHFFPPQIQSDTVHVRWLRATNVKLCSFNSASLSYHQSYMFSHLKRAWINEDKLLNLSHLSYFLYNIWLHCTNSKCVRNDLSETYGQIIGHRV